MKEIKDEERIIARILNVELSFSDRDIVNLENAVLTQENEEQLVKLAGEITEVVEKNKELRKDVEEKIVKAEKDPYDKLNLLVIESELRDLKEDLKRHTYYESGKKLLIGAAVTIALGLISPLILTFFTSSLAILLSAGLSSYFVGMISTMASIKKSDKEGKLIKEQIAKLEKERLDILGYQSENMFESDVVKTNNIAKNIYSVKDLDKEIEDIEIMI